MWVGEYGSSESPPLLLLHGGPGWPHDYLLPLVALADDHRVVVYDQLGCGRSDRPGDPSLWTLDRFVAELGAVIDALGIEAASLLGHSWGSMLALDHYLVAPSSVSTMILASPCLSMRRVRTSMEARVAGLPATVQSVIAKHRAAGSVDSGEFGAAAMSFYHRHVCRLQPWPELLVRSQTAWSAEVYTTMWGPAEFEPTGNLRDYERQDVLGEIAVPVLYLVGAHDEIDPSDVRAYCESTPNAEMVVFDNSAHVAHLEEPDAFLDQVRTFLSSARREVVQP